MITGTSRSTSKNGTVEVKSVIRCAVYTRQSVADDLQFNSLDMQRQSSLAFIESQRGQGWEPVDTRYDDHGVSGGTLQRPAFTQLMKDIENGLVDAVVVYRLDRLSRSLIDFVHLLDFFEEHGTTFASVSEQFNTDTPIGRFTLNILMGISQLERESIAARTRDKMGASRRKGLWTGGRAMLGYDAVKKKLVVNQDEATRVREIFELFTRLGSLTATMEELRHREWKSKTNRVYDKESLRRLLTSPLYIGKVSYRGEVYDGAHEPIVSEKVWKAAQRKLKRPEKRAKAMSRNKTGALLRGLMKCGGLWIVHGAALQREEPTTVRELRLCEIPEGRSRRLSWEQGPGQGDGRVHHRQDQRYRPGFRPRGRRAQGRRG